MKIGEIMWKMLELLVNFYPHSILLISTHPFCDIIGSLYVTLRDSLRNAKMSPNIAGEYQ